MVIGFHCITPAKFEQKATLLRQGYSSTAPVVNEPATEEALQGSYEVRQHPVTGESIRIWVPAEIVTDSGVADDPLTTDIDESVRTQVYTFECQARAIITGGLNVQGTTERWTSKGTYENVDFVELKVPPTVLLTKRDRVTNITDSHGNVVWKEEEMGSFKPSIFDVQGVAPVIDPFGSVIEYVAMLQRSEIQTDSGVEGDA